MEPILKAMIMDLCLWVSSGPWLLFTSFIYLQYLSDLIGTGVWGLPQTTAHPNAKQIACGPSCSQLCFANNRFRMICQDYISTCPLIQEQNSFKLQAFNAGCLCPLQTNSQGYLHEDIHPLSIVSRRSNFPRPWNQLWHPPALQMVIVWDNAIVLGPWLTEGSETIQDMPRSSSTSCPSKSLISKVQVNDIWSLAANRFPLKQFTTVWQLWVLPELKSTQ